jgi:hypothetical protein
MFDRLVRRTILTKTNEIMRHYECGANSHRSKANGGTAVIREA